MNATAIPGGRRISAPLIRKMQKRSGFAGHIIMEFNCEEKRMIILNGKNGLFQAVLSVYKIKGVLFYRNIILKRRAAEKISKFCLF